MSVSELHMLLISERCNIDASSLCIAVPTASGSLEWKRPSQCVWEDHEFSQNGLKLQSKVTIKPIIEQHAPATTLFFTTILKLPNAGIDELLKDLQLLQETTSNDWKIVFLLYERIQTYCRSSTIKIKYISIGLFRDNLLTEQQRCFRKQPFSFCPGVQR
jgi:hypothetical protein